MGDSVEWLWNKLVTYFNELIDWLYQLLLWIPKTIFAEIMDALASVIEAIPVPGFVLTAGDAFQGIPSTILFFANKFALGEGITMILAAYLLRFIIRRIPIIG